ncbi:MAG: DUF4956 domain-containing protein [Anaerolineae bacterium]|nr:DUF4956 domain-containing protein [Anaerolineae bacterium]
MVDLNAPAPLSLGATVLNMAIGLILSMIVAWYYEHYGQSLSNRHKFARLLPVLTLTTALVISIVKSSLALSLGLVGALSIVRFRTAIKEPEELLFLFIAIAIGLGVGADQRWVTLAGVLLVLGYMALRILLSRKPPADNLYLNLLIREGEDESSLFSRVNARLLEHVDVADFRRLDSRDGVLQATYFIHCRSPQTLNDLIDDLKRTFPIDEISFIQQDQVLGG